MKRTVLSLLALCFAITVMGQQQVQLRSIDKAECTESNMTSLKASFSFSTIEAQDYQSERGTFSWLSLPNTVLGGNVGDPQIPVVNQLIAVPFGASPTIRVTSYSTTDYQLNDLGIRTLVPRQAPLRKDQNPDEVPFIMNEAAYQTRGLRSEPTATVNVLGTMRGVQVGTMTIEPLSYDPVSNTLRVFNDIEVEVGFFGADTQATEDMLLKTYSPCFDNVYSQLFNNRAITDVYTQHPDLYNTPVRMLVICYSGFQGNSALNSWLQWKLQKGYYVDIFYTSETGTSATNIKNFIKTKYNASVSAGNAYTYLIVIGDTGQVPQYMTKTIDSSIGECASDLGYAAVNFTTSSTSNYFPDMYYSRISVENTTHLTNYMNKVLTYEKFEFADGGNYLNNVILVGGWDSNWTNKVAKPTINYATNNYFNSSNTTYGGFSGGTIHATISTSSTQGWSGTNHGCYNGLNDGVCFLNYTAHGDKQEWQGPQFTAKQVEGVTNTGKYFFGVGNCCLTGNYNLNDANYSSSYAPSSSIGATASFGETMIRVPNAGAIAYVGCSPYSYWYEDFYWAVGAHSYSAGNAPSVSGSSTGVYDAMFNDANWNSASALLYLGNLAVQQAVTNGNTNSQISGSGDGGDCNNSAHYYFQFYHTFGDGSIMPYITKPETNTVTIPSVVTPGTTSITVNALAGSYVAVTDNSSVIYGVAEANSSGVATVNFTNAIPGTGTLHVVVTRQQYQPYFGTIQIVGGTQYNITVNQPEHGTISAPAQAYASTPVTLTATPETGYCLSSWTVKKGNTTIPVTNNQFTMPEGDVTVTATFVSGMAVTLASVMNGTISADPLYALQGNTINLTATPASGYSLESWIVYKTGDVNTTVTVNGNSFTMPNYPVTVSAIFSKPATNDVTIGSGTGTDAGSDLPTDVYYKYSLSQQIYTAAELGSAGNITKISFYYNSSTSSGSRTLAIYMSHTTSSTLSTWVTQSSSNLVYSGSHNFTQGWNTITLTTPFAYNGTNNLLLTVDDNTGSYSVSQYIYFYTYSTGANRAIYYRNDNNNPSATSSNSYSATKVQYNAQMKVTKEVPNTEGYLSVSPTSLSDFQTVAGVPSDPQSFAVVGNNLQANLTVTAPTGYQVCATQNGTYNSTLTLTPSDGSIRANVFVRLGINTNPGEYNGNLTLASGTTTANVSLSGTVLPGDIEYPVTLTANPSAGGNVTGAGEYNYNTTITVTATANTGYTFVNWTLNGEVVSTNAAYSFTVTEATDLVANFMVNSYTVLATPNPAEGGSVAFSGNYNVNQYVYDFENGTTQGWTILQGTNGDSPDNWMHCLNYTGDNFTSGYGHNSSNGFMISESLVNNSDAVHPDNYLISPQVALGGSINFWATNLDSEYGAEHFAVAVSTNSNTNVNDFTTVQEWTLPVQRTGGSRTIDDGVWYEYTADLSAFSGLGYVAIHHFDCYEQWLLCVDDITISEGHSFNHGESCTLTATANEGYVFVNWTENGQQVSTSASYNFVVTGDRNLVANFEAATPIVQHTFDLDEGWTWWSTNLLITLDDLKAALGTNGLKIEAQNGRYVSYNVNTNKWTGNLTSIEIGVMYKISTSTACTITFTGEVADPSEHDITLYSGNNWIGFISEESMTLNQAFSNFTPADRDVIKSANNGKATYYQGYGWRGGLTTMEPGQGYIYKSNATTTQTFTYPSAK